MSTPANLENRRAELAQNLAAVNQRLEQALAHADPPHAVTLIAVSKTKPSSDIVAAANAGQRAFGENYAQELADKAAELTEHDIEWHFIGPLQSNKTKLIANAAAWVHSVDRLKIAQRLNDQRSAQLPALNVCIQVNISQEPQKAGVAIDDCHELAGAIAEMPQLNLRGLMCIPKPNDTQAFSRIQALSQQLREAGYLLDCLSMGMSNDFERAIEYGATHVRVGTAIFGKRQ